MIEVVVLKPSTMNRVSEITGESIAELEVKYSNACAQNEVVCYTVQTWWVKRPFTE